MSRSSELIIGKILLSLVAVVTIISPYLADWNATHIDNPLWPPHAKFHNAQTMSMAVLLGCASLWFLWRQRKPGTNLAPAILFAALYWMSQIPAFLFPGVAWTDPNLLHAGQKMSDVPIQLKGDLVLFAIIGASYWLMRRGDESPAPSAAPTS